MRDLLAYEDLDNDPPVSREEMPDYERLNDTALTAYRRGFDHSSRGGKRSGNPYTDAANKREWLRGFNNATEAKPRRK